MKRILATPVTPEPVIFANDLPACPIIGTCPRQGLQTKGFIQRVDPFNDQTYQITIILGVTIGRRYPMTTLGGTLAKALSHPDLDYFLFDTEKELFEWLLK
jgi:hypothetical protein